VADSVARRAQSSCRNALQTQDGGGELDVGRCSPQLRRSIDKRQMYS